MDLRQAVEMAKKNFDEGKDRQTFSRTDFFNSMNIKEGFGKKVAFNTTDVIEQKIDKLKILMGKLMIEDKGQNRQFRP